MNELMAAGLMTPAGLRAVERAKADGSWASLDGVQELDERDDLAVRLAAEPAARAHWDQFPRSTTQAILEWIGAARTLPHGTSACHRRSMRLPSDAAPTSGVSRRRRRARSPTRVAGPAWPAAVLSRVRVRRRRRG